MASTGAFMGWPRPGLLRAGLRLGALLVAAGVVRAGESIAAGADVAALTVLAVVWGLGRPRRRRAWVGGTGLAVTIFLLAAAWLVERLPEPPADAWIAPAEQAWRALAGDFKANAERAAMTLARLTVEKRSRLEIFADLERQAGEEPARGRTLIYFDANGDAVAWAGTGLLHEPDPFALPRSGMAFQRGYSAVTLYAVAPLGSGRRSGRVVVGRSFDTSQLPFALASPPPWDYLWSLAEEGTVAEEETTESQATEVTENEPEVIRLEAPESPTLLIAPRRAWTVSDDATAPVGESVIQAVEARALVSSVESFALPIRRLAALVLALTLLALAALAAPVFEPPSDASPVICAAATAAAFWVGAHAARVAEPVAWLLMSGGALSAWSFLRRRRSSVRDDSGVYAGSLVPVVLAAGFTGILGRVLGPVDLAADLAGGVEVWALRLAVALLALGLFGLAGGRLGPATDDRAGWLALLFLLVAAALHDRPGWALPPLVVSGAALGHFLAGLDLSRRPLALGAVLLLTATSGAVAFEIAHREVFRLRLAEDYLPRLAPPGIDEVTDLHNEIHAHFEGFDLRRVTPPVTAPETTPSPAAVAGSERSVRGHGMDPQDLAYVLWRHSPLPRRDGASAVIVELADGSGSSFSFGLPLDRDFRVTSDPERWPIPPVGAWREAVITGEADLVFGGQPWGYVRYWLLPRPGFRLEVDELAELEAGLVRGEPRRLSIDGLPRPALFGLYTHGGRAIMSPWDEAPPLPEEARLASRGILDTPAGPAWYFSATTGEVIEVLFLPRWSIRQGLVRVGIHALSGLAALAAVFFFGFVVVLPRDMGWRGIFKRPLRSYSKRLLLVYTVLLLVPLVALNLILLRGFEERLRQEQLRNGRSAIASARLLLVDYLRGLEPGFGIDTEINRELLEWISSLVRHQVNLYWGSQVYASSQQELFTAGLLPKRIPGEVFARLALYGNEVGSRTQRTGGVTYLELYAPLEPFGGSEQGLFLSVPLLAQEEEVARELAHMRQRAVLVTAALFFLLTAVGGRLARSFTTPLMELIEGTRKIAAGATFLAVTPRESELEALAAAIDEMARRLAEGRHKLVLEKQLVERIVDNITSGVVSLDHERRVILRNRVAAELLGVEVGRRIEEHGGEAESDPPALVALAPFLAEIEDEEPRQTTVQLTDQAGELREWTLTWVPMPGPEDPAALLVVDDDTEVLRGQRLEAWAEMARIIAHEIKNPLTPIRLSAEHLRQVYKSHPERLDEVFERCTRNILIQVEELRELASDFSIYSRIPRAEMAPGELLRVVREVVEAYGDISESGVELELESPLEELAARFDEKLLGRAVRNLIENALRASAGAAARGEEPRVSVSVERIGDDGGESRAVIAVADSGPGVDPENLARIFEPYFSTHETGTGLGLAIARRIAEEHSGRLEARNRPGGGLAVTITIPLTSEISSEAETLEENSEHEVPEREIAVRESPERERRES